MVTPDPNPYAAPNLANPGQVVLRLGFATLTPRYLDVTRRYLVITLPGRAQPRLRNPDAALPGYHPRRYLVITPPGGARARLRNTDTTARRRGYHHRGSGRAPRWRARAGVT
eukprot:scaffold59690_cov37-Phaeocystis_antarctica.AAC.2